MARIYNGNVEVILNTKNKITVRANEAGKFNQENVTDLHTAMVGYAKKHDAELNFFTPDNNAKDLAPVLLSGRGNSPYMAMLPAKEAGSTTSRPTVTVLG